MAYERKQYSIAIDLLSDEYDNLRNKSDKSRKAYLLGKSYINTGDTEQAAFWLQTAYDEGYGPEATQALAKTYKKLGNYAKAISVYNDLKRHVAGREQEINREIFICETISTWTTNEDYDYKLSINKYNSPDADYGGAIFEDDYIVFTSDREGGTSNEIYKWSGANYSDMYIANKKGGNTKRFDATLNSKHNDGSPCFSQDYTEIYFTRCYSDEDAKDATCKIMFSERSSGIWSNPIPLDFTIGEFNYGHPTLIEGDSVLIFSANLPSSLGAHDLYYTERIYAEDESFEWAEPSPMPQTINTQGEELFPTSHGDTLYYSSDYLPGYGGLDIFKTYLKPNGSWSPPENLKKPINSPQDDFGFIVDEKAQLRGRELKKGFFTSSRKGYGYEDIYSYIISSKKDVPVIEDPTDPVDEKKNYILNLVLQTETFIYEEETNSSSKSNLTKKLGKVRIVLTVDGDAKILESNSDGSIIIPVEENKQYSIRASKNGYLNASGTLDTRNVEYPEGQISYTFNKKLVLDKVFYNQEIVLENIYYDYNEWKIREDAQPTLDSLAALLISNPQLKIELASHTDCRGEDDYNMILSQKRAQSAVAYIVSKGVNKQILTPKGYGETKPNDFCDCDNCSEDQHQINRRTSFKILK